MAHTSKTPSLGRKRAPRKAMMTNLMTQLLRHKRIKTTTARAKLLARNIAPVITHARKWSQKNSTHAYRHAFSILRDKEVTSMLFEDILPKVGDRQGGYTRCFSLENRKGDQASISMIELVDFSLFSLKKTTKTKTRRGRKKKVATESAVKGEGTKQVAEESKKKIMKKKNEKESMQLATTTETAK